jgi:hypothetical protein
MSSCCTRIASVWTAGRRTTDETACSAMSAALSVARYRCIGAESAANASQRRFRNCWCAGAARTPSKRVACALARSAIAESAPEQAASPQAASSAADAPPLPLLFLLLLKLLNKLLGPLLLPLASVRPASFHRASRTVGAELSASR